MNYETEEMLTAMLDGQLTAEQELELRARLENEAGLRDTWEQLQAQQQLLRGLARVKAPEDFLGKVAVALQGQAPEVTRATLENDDSGLRPDWRAVAALASALAATVLLGVFLWPRNAAQNSGQVASFEGNDRARQQQVEELKRLEKGDWVESAPVQRTPSGTLSKASEMVDGSVESTGSASNPARAAGSLEAAPPRARLGENLQAQAAPADALLSEEAERPAQRNVEAVDSAGKKAAEIAGVPQRMSEFRGGEPPVLEANSLAAGVPGGFGAGAGQVGPVEVWIINQIASAESAAGEAQTVDASQVEVYFASVAEMSLPDWLSELQASAAITRLDTDESRELLGQLAQRKQPHEKRADAKPTSVADADLEGPVNLRVGGADGVASGKREEAAAQVGYLGRQEAAPLDALLTRAQRRQLIAPKPAEPRGDDRGFGAGGSAGLAASDSQYQAKSSLESSLSKLRTRSAEFQPLPQASPPVGGRNVLIIIRGR